MDTDVSHLFITTESEYLKGLQIAHGCTPSAHQGAWQQHVLTKY